MKRIIIALFSFTIIACNELPEVDERISYEPDGGVTLDVGFHGDATYWRAGFSDYPVAAQGNYQLTAGMTVLPHDPEQRGFLLSGNNPDADLFMYLKRQVHGLQPNTEYKVHISSQISTNAGENCLDIGGARGESVFMKAGASVIEPVQVDYYLNIDIGRDSEEGSDAFTLSDITSPHLDCSGDNYTSLGLVSDSDRNFTIKTNDEGTVWLFLGADSGYEGATTIYIEYIVARLTPIVD